MLGQNSAWTPPRGATALLGGTATVLFLTVRAKFGFVSVHCPVLLDSVWPGFHPRFCSPAFSPIQKTGVCLLHFKLPPGQALGWMLRASS